jgi:hypothetical protein
VPAKIADRVLLALASGLALSTLIAGWHDVSQAYDVWYYHLPFAGRLAGILDPHSYAFSAENQERYAGFPLFGELVMGLLWRITGHVAATNLLSVAALFALPIFLWRLHGVPPHVAFLALFAIPLVQIHATSSYVDLPANVLVTMLVLCVHRAWIHDTSTITPRFLLGAALLAAAAANTKFQLVPIVCIAALALAIRARRWIVLLAVPVVLATPIKNTIAHHNPVWPVALGSLPHVENAYASSPPGLEEAWRPTRFVHSVLELDNHPVASHERWSLDQWTPPSDPAYRMGGYFGLYVVINLVAFGAGLRRRTRADLVTGAVFGGVTVVAAMVPQSHELRYYMHWMLVLVSLNLIRWAKDRRLATGLVALGALAVVAWSTEGGYLYASGSNFDTFLAKRVDPSALAPGQLCLEKPPFTVLYAPVFHPERPTYAVQEKAAESDCERMLR